jgi:hypothetical protein
LEVATGDASPPPSGMPPELALHALEEGIGRAEDLLNAFRGDRGDRTASGAGRIPAGVGSEGVAPASVVTTLVAPAERFVSLVARASLRAQEQVEAVIARRTDQAPAPVALPEWWPEALWYSARAEIERAAERSAQILRTPSVEVGPARPRSVPPSIVERLAPLMERGDLRSGARALAVVVALGVFVVQILGVGRGPSDVVEQVAPAPVATTAPAATPPPAVDPVPQDDAAVVTPPDPVRMAPPVLLRLPSIEVDARVVVVGLEPDGAMEIPSDVRTVGWYEPFEGAGVAPGEPGTAVIAGHVDSRTQGRGAFWSLRELVPGDVVEIDHSDGTSTRWLVESVVRYPKTDIPIEEIFTFEGEERLALITCGGEFDRPTRSYLDNYVVTAVPLRTSVGGNGPSLSPSP